MKFLVALIVLVVSASAQAAVQFVCEVQLNQKKVFETNVVLKKEKDEKIFLRSQEFEMKLSHVSGNSFELQIYDRMKPSRAYSKAMVSQKDDLISYSLWEREGILDVFCRLSQALRR